MSIEIKYFKDRKEWQKKDIIARLKEDKTDMEQLSLFSTHINASELPTLKQQGNGLKNLKND